MSEGQNQNERDISDEIDIIHVKDGWHMHKIQYDEATHMSLWECPYCHRLVMLGEFFPESSPQPAPETPPVEEQPPQEEKKEPDMVESPAAPGVLEPNPRKRRKKEEKEPSQEQQTQ